MLFKKIFIFLLFIFFNNISFANQNVYIVLTIDDQIITNVDIEKEANYLLILNPNLTNLEKNKILNIAKKNLINENIKKKEIKEFFLDEKREGFDKKIFENFLRRLDLNEFQLEQILYQRNSYPLNEVKEKLRTEIFWNDLIYLKFNNQIKIDEKKLLEKINNLKDTERKEYLLSEIIFEKKIDQNLDELTIKIKNSISEIGFGNTANIYSVSESAKFGGNIGWIPENNLSKPIIEKIKNKKKNEYSDLIQIGNSYMILLVEETRFSKIEIDKEVELKKMIEFERNKLLNKFSKIYFNKTKMNYSINEN